MMMALELYLLIIGCVFDDSWIKEATLRQVSVCVRVRAHVCMRAHTYVFLLVHVISRALFIPSLILHFYHRKLNRMEMGHFYGRSDSAHGHVCLRPGFKS